MRMLESSQVQILPMCTSCDIFDRGIVWTSKADQEAWTISKPPGKIQEMLGSISTGLYNFWTISPSEDFTTVLSAPVTKLFIWYFPHTTSPLTPELEAIVPEKFVKFVNGNATNPEGVLGAKGGWRLKEDQAFGENGRSFTGIIGVKTVESLRMQPPFENNIEGRKGMTMRTFKLSRLI